ncbi:sensor histidine kinase [Anaerosacchariphilus polymeriproducens]|nr:sensor histidine kinase [Anaerosacchariphilus polymeriproducens]
MSDILLNFLTSFADAFIYYRIMNCKLDFKFKNKYRIFVFLSPFVMMWLRYFIRKKVVNFTLEIIMCIIIYLSTFILSYSFYKGSIFKRTIYPFLYTLFLMSVENIAYLISSIIFVMLPTDILKSSIINMILAIFTKTFQIIIIELLVRNNKVNFSFPKNFMREAIALVCLEYTFIIFFVSLWNMQKYNTISISIGFVISVTIVVSLSMKFLTFLILYKLKKRADNDKEENLRMQQIEMSNKLNQDMTSVVDSLRSLRHDMNSHMGIIKGLLELAQYDELSKYLDSICEDLNISNHFIIINNKVLSVLINGKVSKAIDRGIDFLTSISVNKIVMSERDMCALISNIIENAIEATDKVDQNKYIKFRMKEQENQCLIYCENTYAEKPIIKGENFLTTKTDKGWHGIGIKTIKSIVEKYNGLMKVEVEKLFIISIIIPN